MGLSRRSLAALAAAGLLAAAAGAAAWLWYAPGPLLAAVAEALSRQAGLAFSPGQIGGNAVSGFVIHDLKLDLPQAELSVPSARVRLDWRRLLRRQVAVDSVELLGPRLLLRPRNFRNNRPPPAGWAGSIASLRVTDATVETQAEPGRPSRRARVREAELRYADRRLELRSAELSIEGATLTARGTVAFAPFSVEAVLGAAEPVAGELRVRGLPGRWDLDGRGKWRGVELVLFGELHSDHSWRADLKFSKLDPRLLAPGAPPALEPLSGEFEARGRGLSPAEAEGRAALRLAEGGGLALSAEAGLSSGAVSWSLSPSSGGLSGSAEGRFSLADRKLAASWTLAADRALVSRFAGGWQAQARSSGSAAGVWPALDWTLKLSAADLSGRGFKAARAELDAAGRGPVPFEGKAAGSLERVTGLQAALDSLRFQVEGSSAAHRVSLQVREGRALLELHGAGRLEGTRWNARWSRLLGRRGPSWRSTGPFSTSIEKGAWSLTGLTLSDGRARLSADAEYGGGLWRHLRLRAERFDLRSVGAARLWQLPVRGRLDAELDLRGKLSSPEGSVSARIEEGGVERYDFGRIEGRARLRAGSLLLDALDWKPATGTASLSGSVPLAAALKGERSYDLTLNASGLDLSFLALRLPGAVVSSFKVDGSLRLKGARGRAEAQGALKVRADQVSVASGAVVLRPLELELAGDGTGLKITRGEGRSGKGSAGLSGRIDLAGPNLEVKAHALPFRTQSGLSGLMNAQLKLFGPWSSPVLMAAVDLPRADYAPPKAQAGAPQGSPPTLPANVAVDLRVRFDSNVWYKSEDTSIESKGDLALQKEAGGEPRLFGGIETIRGAYVYYGRNFDIQQGRLVFDGTLPPDPRLNVQAQYVDRASGTKILLNATGTLQQPLVALSSEPPMEERDIISLLAFGKPLYQVSSAKDQATVQAAAEVVSSYLSQQIKESLFGGLNLDVFRVRVGGPSSSVTLGRYVVKNLFVSYDQPLGSGQGTLATQYTLTPNWSLSGQNTTDGRYILDLLFKYGIK